MHYEKDYSDIFLLTGSTGFLGKEIYNYIHRFNIVYTLSRQRSNYNFDLSKQIPIFNKTFDCIIHSAGLAHVISSKSNICNYFKINVQGTRNLIKALEREPKLPRYFILISSVSVYGNVFGDLLSEKEPRKAIDPYGKSKIECEDFLINWCRQNNVVLTIFRLPLVVGENPPGNLANMIKAIKHGFYFNISHGQFNKSMVLSTDVARIILKSYKIGGIYNLTDTYHPTLSEFSNILASKMNKKKPRRIPIYVAKLLSYIGDILPFPFYLDSLKLKKLTSTLTFDDSKAKEILNWNPQRVIDNIELIFKPTKK